MENNETRIVEVGGVKMEIDMRHATVQSVDTYRIGDKVKLLKASAYAGDSHVVYPGVIVGFENFEELPTIVVCYIDRRYNEVKLEMSYINKSSKSQMVHAAQYDIPFEKQDVLDTFEMEIKKSQEEVDKLKARRQFFLEKFGQFFEHMAEPIKTAGQNQ